MTNLMGNKQTIDFGFDLLLAMVLKWWPEAESNCRHEDFQSTALPTELSGHN